MKNNVTHYNALKTINRYKYKLIALKDELFLKTFNEILGEYSSLEKLLQREEMIIKGDNLKIELELLSSNNKVIEIGYDDYLEINDTVHSISIANDEKELLQFEIFAYSENQLMIEAGAKAMLIDFEENIILDSNFNDKELELILKAFSFLMQELKKEKNNGDNKVIILSQYQRKSRE